MCAFHVAMARRLRVDVTTTVPSASPEYMRSLSSEKQTTFTGLLWLRMRCLGVGGGGAVMLGKHRRQALVEAASM